LVVVVGVLVVIELVFFSSVFVVVVGIVVGIFTDDEREDDDDEFCLDKDILDSKSLSDGVNIVELFLFDDDSEELSSEETSKGSKVSEPNTG
jgi:hypothetical protein